MTPHAPLLSHLALWTALLAPGLALAQAQPTGTVDSQRAALDSVAGRKAQAMLKGQSDRREADLDRERTQLQKEKEALDKERISGKNPDALLKKVDAWNRKVVELQSLYSAHSNNQARQQKELLEPIERDVREAIARIATARGFGLVVERSAVPYASGNLDITDDVIKMVDAGPGAKK
jgi:Skp family chaperone for outer membrane proteins